jgi:hypothetical protein
VLQDHPKDAELLNKPIQHYEQMKQVFGGGMTTGGGLRVVERH